jgi:hypothetical protein
MLEPFRAATPARQMVIQVGRSGHAGFVVVQRRGANTAYDCLYEGIGVLAAHAQVWACGGRRSAPTTTATSR